MAVDIKLQLNLLKKLQGVDLRIHQIDLRLKEIPQKIQDARALFDTAKVLFTAKEKEKHDVEHGRRTFEKDLEADVAHVKDREMRLYAIKTNKEYQAALKEIADAKKANKDREDAILGLMEKNEQLAKEITQLSKEVADKESEYKKVEAELKKDEEEIKKERERDIVEREALTKELERDILRLYQFIRSRYHDALVAAKNGVCTGCNMNVPPQLFIELRKFARLSQCPNCKRLLYFYEEADVVNEAPVEENKTVVT